MKTNRIGGHGSVDIILYFEDLLLNFEKSKITGNPNFEKS
jgi:hypothetical protein